MKKTIISLSLLTAASLAQAQLVVYNLDNTAPYENTGATSAQAQPVPGTAPYATVDSNLTASLSYSANHVTDQRGGAFWDDSYNFVDWDEASLTTTDYLSIIVTANSGFEMNLTNLSLVLGGSSDTYNWAVRSDVDGFTADLATGTTIGSNINPSLPSIALTGHSGLTSVEFRIYGWGGSAGLSTRMAIGAPGTTDGRQDVALTGTVTPVPEPSTYALIAGLGVVGLLAIRRRK